MMNKAVQTTEISLGQHRVRIPAGGIYDRWRMQTDLDALQREHPEISDWQFPRSFTKREITGTPIGTTYSPNLYHDASILQIACMASRSALQALIPREARAKMLLPGVGAFVVTAFSYRVCDNDAYNEFSVAVLIDKPKGQSARKNPWACVLHLPVTTDLACVRGVAGYGLPKYVTRIEMETLNSGSRATAYDPQSGKSDLVLRAGAVRAWKDGGVSTAHAWSLLNGQALVADVDTRNLRMATQWFSSATQIELGQGPMSDTLRRIGPFRVVRTEIKPQAQLALHWPVPV